MASEMEEEEWPGSFRICLPKAWWKSHYQPDQRILASGWGDDVKEQFSLSKPEGVLCTLIILRNHVVHADSAKVASAPAFTGVLGCNSKVCSMKYTLTIERAALQSKSILINVNRKYRMLEITQ